MESVVLLSLLRATPWGVTNMWPKALHQEYQVGAPYGLLLLALLFETVPMTGSVLLILFLPLIRAPRFAAIVPIWRVLVIWSFVLGVSAFVLRLLQLLFVGVHHD